MRPTLPLYLLLGLPVLVTAEPAPAATVAEAQAPARGELRFKVSEHPEWLASSASGDVFSIPHKARRWGRYTVDLIYTAKTPVEVRFTAYAKSESSVTDKLAPAGSGKTTASLGSVYLAEAGAWMLKVSMPANSIAEGFALQEVALVPSPEGTTPDQVKDGSLLLLAKDATTFSENMRYEPNPVKNCLGYWTEKDDFAEWNFTVSQPGRFNVTVHQGNGGNGGSEVAVVCGTQRLGFTVKGTGGYQKWQPVPVGEMVFDKPGTYTLAVKPQTKVGGAVMDVQKVELTPVPAKR